MSDYQGNERRLTTMTELAEIKTDIAVIKTTIGALDRRINGSIGDIEKHIERGTGWRIAISGVAFGLVVQIILFAYFFGTLSKQVTVNTDRISRIE